MLLVDYITNILGVFVFLFIFWKRQKDDFSSDIIFKLAFNILVGITIGGFVAKFFIKEWWMWSEFVGGVAGLTLGMLRLRLKFFEIFESFVIASLPWLSLEFLINSVKTSSLSSFLGFLTILLIIFISYWFDASYKNFTWYKSGKIGFSGLATLALIFLTRFGLALGGFSVLSFVGKFEWILSLVGFLLAMSALVYLSRKD